VTGGALSAVLEAACDVMTDLAIYPLALDADTGGAHMLAVMGSRALLTRSRGPYAADNLPPEALSTAESIQLRLSMQSERPEFTVEGGGPWPRLVVVLPSRGVLVRYVVPEEAPPIYQPAPNNATLSGDIKLAIRFVARSLQVASRQLGGTEPPVTVALSHPDDPDYDAKIATMPPEFREYVAPIIPTVELHRGRCSSEQREVHDTALRSVAYSDQTLHPLGDKGFTTRIGSARIRDDGS
jgi:hypothetical protein